MLERQEASDIIAEVRDAIKDWRTVASALQIAPKQIEAFSPRWDEL